jgi:integrase
MGLGSLSDVSLAEARELASEYRKLYKKGLDPRFERDKRKAELRALESSSITFEEASKQYIELHKAKWKNPKHAQQWENTLEQYAFPIIGKVPCSDINTEHVLQILEPIWVNKNETASRLRGRIESVLDWSIAKEYRTESNVATLKGKLKHLLPQINKRQRIEHHKAMKYEEIPNFFKTIKDDISTSTKALIFCILTATRTSETIEAKWSEIDLSKRIWTIPKERMKKAKEHRVPLSEQAIELLKTLEDNQSEYVFTSAWSGMKSLSNMAMYTKLRKIDGCEDLTVHGFRSSFRDWAAEKTDHGREVCEQALAHSLADAAEAAYQRGEYLEKRTNLMNDWASYCFSKAI